MTDKLKALREVLEGATSGPWEVGEPDFFYEVARCQDENGDVSVLVEKPRRKPGTHDAAFIATFDPNLVSALLDVAEAAGGMVDLDSAPDDQTVKEFREGRIGALLAALDNFYNQIPEPMEST